MWYDFHDVKKLFFFICYRTVSSRKGNYFVGFVLTVQYMFAKKIFEFGTVSSRKEKFFGAVWEIDIFVNSAPIP